MEREYTARNGMEEFTTRGLREQERMASRMRETATAVKKPLIYIQVFRQDMFQCHFIWFVQKDVAKCVS